ncbi:MAG: HupE/UreJ family protein [Gammaproteobacteria bacterium]|mgnify:CR=1 FL=1|jgi:hydrogenase/urease accessory protein HupE|nr:HupE/UreJ family protein [Gammaproteobacteria bacterium]MBT3859134.1 HupE/UreJ family protein [Gammaproteobacteria bacterium]MBT3987134.1 HupE/UreJ family protein [Gammaproteobacteria bacterium]MBT4254870.1 HupE/UreJ family protein [Gammaproteobacteria bacterium]MBT4580553.1 HupE/UreJ family protein [Gammaproteobacteria bacterium]
MRSFKQSLFIILILGGAAFLGSNSIAHDIDVTGVARVIMDETEEGFYQLSIVDQQVPPLFNIERILPPRCEGLEPGRFSYRFYCEPQLNVDDQLSFPWGFEGVVVIANWNDDSSVSGYFPGDGSDVVIPLADLKAGAASISSLAIRYLELGAEHILLGIDHLLFVLGLLLLVKGFWKLIKTVTAFTIAHSITLAFAVLGIFPVPNAPIEVLIALSIVFLAREVIMAQRGQRTLAHASPWIIAFIFGLIHGFGFAGALGELGLSDGDIPLALLFFNLGVEAGQVAFIGALVTINMLFAKFLSEQLGSLYRGLAYGLGGIAAYWFIERLPSLYLV